MHRISIRISTVAFVHLICILNWIIERGGGDWIKGVWSADLAFSAPCVVVFYAVAICQIESKTSVVV